ncbi:MAG TPA: 16S rRNA (guanine(527)-N(7))-methyltransferase RsmG [Dehalococcoidia bacterium]
MELTSDQLSAFDLYARRLLEANLRTNLTSTRDRDTVYRRHFVESLALLRVLQERDLVRSPAIDVGSGAGFPGLPIKIARPDVDLTLVEATGKKARFLESIVAELGLAAVTVVDARAEELAHNPVHRGAFRLALARTLAPLPVLLELTLPFLSMEGVLAAPKGGAAQRELRESANALAELGGAIEAAPPMELAMDGPQQTVIIVRKTGPTPERYPRRPGMPSKRPL